MGNILFSLILLSSILELLVSCEPKVNGPCSRPDLPPYAKMRDISAETKRFQNKEKVVIECRNDVIDVNDVSDIFPFYGYEIQCINGRWKGVEPRCGVNLNAQVIEMDLFDCNDGYHQSLLENPISVNQTEEAKGDPVPFNAFHIRRVNQQIPVISGPDCPRFKVTFTEKVKIWFLLIELEITQTIASNESIVAPDLKPFVNKYRSCDLREINRTLSENPVTFAYHFICDLIPDTNHSQEEQVNSITFDFNVTEGYDAVFEAIFIGKIYTKELPVSKRVEPRCGKLGVKSIGMGYHEERGFYSVSCNESFIDLNTNSTAPKNPEYRFWCDSNGKWQNNWPICYPKTPCPTDVLMSEIDDSVIIEEFGNVFYFNESQWFAIEDSFVRYSCVDESHRMLGKNVRTCSQKGAWSLKAPTCRSIELNGPYSSGPSGLVIAGILIAILVVFVFIVLIVFRTHSKRVNTELKRTRNEIKESNIKRYSEELYSDVGNGNLYEQGFEMTDIYDTFEPKIANQIRNTKLIASEYIEMKGPDMPLMMTIM